MAFEKELSIFYQIFFEIITKKLRKTVDILKETQ